MPLTKIIPAARLEGMREHLIAFAKEFGITDMKQQPHVANTRKAIAIAEYARDQGKLQEFRYAGMDAYWRDGKNIEDDAVLRELAAGVGLDPDAALAATTDRKYTDRIDARRREANKVGVTGIPTFVIGDQGVVGCQPFEVLEGFVVEVGGAKKRGG